MNSTKSFIKDDNTQKLRQGGLRIFPGWKTKLKPLGHMGHTLLLGWFVPESKLILAALAWITSRENLPKGQEG